MVHKISIKKNSSQHDLYIVAYSSELMTSAMEVSDAMSRPWNPAIRFTKNIR